MAARSLTPASSQAELYEHSHQEGLFKSLPAGQLLVCLASNLVRRRQGLERLALEDDISDDAIVDLQAEALLHPRYNSQSWTLPIIRSVANPKELRSVFAWQTFAAALTLSRCLRSSRTDGEAAKSTCHMKACSNTQTLVERHGPHVAMHAAIASRCDDLATTIDERQCKCGPHQIPLLERQLPLHTAALGVLWCRPADDHQTT